MNRFTNTQTCCEIAGSTVYTAETVISWLTSPDRVGQVRSASWHLQSSGLCKIYHATDLLSAIDFCQGPADVCEGDDL